MSNDPYCPAQPSAEQPRRFRVATLLGSAAPRVAAAVAIAAAPLAAIPIAAASGAAHASVPMHAAACATSVQVGAMHPMKNWECGGD
jgi:hypothetical protein